MDETTDFHKLNSWYQEASNRLETAELVLLIYHQLICYFDADQVREQQAKSTPVENALKPDTATMIYRHNHINDGMWTAMSYEEKKAWAQGMATRFKKSVTQ